MNQPIVAARPEQVLLFGRFCDGENCVVILYAGNVERDRTTRRKLFRSVVAGEVRADRRPCLSLVSALEDHLRARIKRVRVMRREQKREGPLEAILQLACTVS